MEYISTSEKQTQEIAETFAKDLMPGDVLALYGDLGSGKTTFTNGLAKHFGIEKPITSPTFVIQKSYRIEKNESGIVELVHIDAYRMSGSEDAESIGLPEYFNRNDVITIIEWPERIEDMLPERTKKIRFEYLDENRRKINL